MATPTLHIHEQRAADARSLSDRAYYAIRELIVTLELPPGSVVNERELMEQLGLGRTPVREALRDLARQQLVEVYPRRGSCLGHRRRRHRRPLDSPALESQAARLAAERRNDADRAATEKLLEESLERSAETQGGNAARDREAGAFRDVPRRRRGSSAGFRSAESRSRAKPTNAS